VYSGADAVKSDTFIAFLLGMAVGVTLLVLLAQANTPVCPAGVELTPLETQLLEEINVYRIMNDQSPLTTSRELTRAAQLTARELASSHQWAHGDWLTRTQACGVPRGAVDQGELLARGYVLPTQALMGWQLSPEHDRALLSPVYTEAGAARRWSGDQWAVPYWALELGNSP
jgi:uncharacterized protein YkwD